MDVDGRGRAHSHEQRVEAVDARTCGRESRDREGRAGLGDRFTAE